MIPEINMAKYKEFFRRATSAEEQCQTQTTRGQCTNAMMPGSEYCPAHGGNRGYTAMRKENRRLYEIGRYQDKISRMADHEGANSFREEIAVLRMMLETRLQGCQDDHDLMMHSQTISSLVMNIEKAVGSALKLETQLGKVLTEEQATAWTAEILEIIGNHVTDPATLEAMSDELLQSLDKVTTPDRESIANDLPE
jgi:hypothetical protein